MSACTRTGCPCEAKYSTWLITAIDAPSTLGAHVLVTYAIRIGVAWIAGACASRTTLACAAEACASVEKSTNCAHHQFIHAEFLNFYLA